jgi:dihydrodipicolinate synthase/N-acetylneuraminate lyase
MMQKCLIAVSLLVFIVSPALAAEYYVAHKPPKKEACKIVDKKPDGKTMVMVGTSSYATRDEAKAAKKAAQAAGDCK